LDARPAGINGVDRPWNCRPGPPRYPPAETRLSRTTEFGPITQPSATSMGPNSTAPGPTTTRSPSRGAPREPATPPAPSVLLPNSALPRPIDAITTSGAPEASHTSPPVRPLGAM